MSARKHWRRTPRRCRFLSIHDNPISMFRSCKFLMIAAPSALLLSAASMLPPAAYGNIGAVNAAKPSVDAADTRWESSLAAFARADREAMPPAGGVLFVGSSSIRLWSDLKQQFQLSPVVINRGFGGSRMRDCAAYLSRLVLPYKPRTVVVYAGENDLAEGRSPQQVLRSVTAFVTGVRAALPSTRIVYVSIKPSIARESMLAQVRAANALVKDYIGGVSNAEYVDVFTPMLDGQGRPRADLFRRDKLHMNASGYAIWHAAIAPAIN
jgi:lysophospholipase L1-like esterase